MLAANLWRSATSALQIIDNLVENQNGEELAGTEESYKNMLEKAQMQIRML